MLGRLAEICFGLWFPFPVFPERMYPFLCCVPGRSFIVLYSNFYFDTICVSYNYSWLWNTAYSSSCVSTKLYYHSMPECPGWSKWRGTGWAHQCIHWFVCFLLLTTKATWLAASSSCHSDTHGTEERAEWALSSWRFYGVFLSERRGNKNKTGLCWNFTCGGKRLASPGNKVWKRRKRRLGRTTWPRRSQSIQ